MKLPCDEAGQMRIPRVAVHDIDPFETCRHADVARKGVEYLFEFRVRTIMRNFGVMPARPEIFRVEPLVSETMDFHIDQF
ncbi:MAG: hypothetical protein BWY40_01125 [bacterium ADurb.Bin270]|nr:MAG: hypothetical protein BWY40_01125 [bacterium ADurb.Bin270]